MTDTERDAALGKRLREILTTGATFGEKIIDRICVLSFRDMRPTGVDGEVVYRAACAIRVALREEETREG